MLCQCAPGCARLLLNAVLSVCADESDDEQEDTERVPSARISTSIVKQATAHLHRDGRYGTTGGGGGWVRTIIYILYRLFYAYLYFIMFLDTIETDFIDLPSFCTLLSSWYTQVV